MTSLRKSLIAGIWLVVGLTVCGEEKMAVLPEKHREVLEFYCYDCHDSATKKGKFDMEALSFEMSANIETAARWQHVLDALNSGEMPPEDKDQLEPEEKVALLEDLSTEMVQARRILSDAGGEVILRRLNRREYQNTLEELIGVRPDVSDLPDDEVSTEYDTEGGSLFFSGDQLENYLAIARRTLELSIRPNETRRKKARRVEPEEAANKFYRGILDIRLDTKARAEARRAAPKKSAKDFGFIDEYQAKRSFQGRKRDLPILEDFLKRPENKSGTTLILTIKQGMNRIKLPNLAPDAPGKYVIRVRAAAYAEADDRMRYIEFVSRRAGERAYDRHGWRKVTGTVENPQIIEFPITHRKGEKTEYVVHQRTHEDRGDKNLWAMDRDENGYGTIPGVWVDWAEVEGPLREEAGASAEHPIIFAAEEGWNQDRHAREIIRRFAEKAFRTQEPGREMLEKLFKHYRVRRDAGEKFQQALIGPLSVILSSPGFLYLTEVESEKRVLRDDELAVRLAYFLWSSPPDEELMTIARDGGLSDSKVLAAQTERMMKDARFGRFKYNFVRQWLEMERLEIFQFAARQYRDFDNATRDSAAREVYETVELMLEEKLPLGTLLDADFVVINDVLADYYGIPGVEGFEFRQVVVPEGSPRGGLLGTAAVMAMGSDGIRSSPVERGAWVLRHLLNDPPPPAPANVPQLSRFDEEVLSSRALQRAHQEEPQCMQCHRKIDPIGFALENFDASGSWRETEKIFEKRMSKEFTEFPLETAGKLPNGMSFEGYYSLRGEIAKRSDDFASGFMEALIAYGLGRPYGFTDELPAMEILERCKSEGYEIGSLIHGLVQSDLFNYN